MERPADRFVPHQNVNLMLLVKNPLTGIDYRLLVSFNKFRAAFPSAANGPTVLNATKPVQLVGLCVPTAFELVVLIETGVAQNTDQIVYGELYGFLIRNSAAPRLIQAAEGVIATWSEGDRLESARAHLMMGCSELLMHLIRKRWIAKQSLLSLLALYGGSRGNFTNFDIIHIFTFLFRQ